MRRIAHDSAARVPALALALLAALAACSTLEGTQRPKEPSRPTGAAAPPSSGSPSATSGATQALLAQSRTARAAGNYAQANATIERALRIAPSDASLWVELGEIELATGNAAQAATLARKALTLASADDRTTISDAQKLLRAAGGR